MTDRDIALFDVALQRRRRARAAAAAEADRFIARDVAESLFMRLSGIERAFERVLILGGGLVPMALPPGRLAPDGLCITADTGVEALAGAAGPPGPRLVLDDGALPMAAGSLDLLVSALRLHAVNDLPGVLAQIRAALRPDGLFLAALFGGDTLAELRESLLLAEIEVTGGAGARVSPFAQLQDCAALLQRAGFALPVADREEINVTYESPLSLIADLRAMGETSALADRPARGLSRRILARVFEQYAERHPAPGGRIAARFEILYLHGWAPHASQARPARRGSGEVSLGTALEAIRKAREGGDG
ncbi:MAG: methyltransferase domain-containing protein [Alphaproteobacteria bacterium]|nr:methyltransferase domain-containing protein [Alphaproteobacteria bacterium]